MQFLDNFLGKKSLENTWIGIYDIILTKQFLNIILAGISVSIPDGIFKGLIGGTFGKICGGSTTETFIRISEKLHRRSFEEIPCWYKKKDEILEKSLKICLWRSQKDFYEAIRSIISEKNSEEIFETFPEKISAGNSCRNLRKYYWMNVSCGMPKESPGMLLEESQQEFSQNYLEKLLGNFWWNSYRSSSIILLNDSTADLCRISWKDCFMSFSGYSSMYLNRNFMYSFKGYL